METINELRDSGLTILHFILAFAGVALNLLMKMGEEYNQEGFALKGFLKKHLISIIFSIIATPVLLIVATDSSLKDFLPVNNITAVLCGWQTQSVFKTIFSIKGKRINPNTPQDATR
jgi:hypothetical protein